MSTSTIDVKCSCGGKLEHPRNPKPTDAVKCVRCGATGKYGTVVKTAKALVEKQLKDALRKAGFK